MSERRATTRIQRAVEQTHPWQYSAVAVVLTVGITSTMSVFFHGYVTDDYLITGAVAAALVSYPMMWVVYVYQRRLREEMDERAAMEQRLRVSGRMATVGTLAAGVAHEINNPLAYAVLNLEVLAERVDEGAVTDPETRREMEELLDDIRHGVERVRDIVADLHSFSRPVDETPKPVHLEACIDSAVKLAKLELRHNARLVVELGELPPVVGVDGRLAQVFLNLLVNASQALPPGDPDSHEVRIAAAVEGDSVVVWVSDDGPGVPPELRGRIFDPFFTTKGPREGTGLGLSISHHIVADLGGELTLEPSESGAVFRIALRRATEPAERP